MVEKEEIVNEVKYGKNEIMKELDKEKMQVNKELDKLEDQMKTVEFEKYRRQRQYERKIEEEQELIETCKEYSEKIRV